MGGCTKHDASATQVLMVSQGDIIQLGEIQCLHHGDTSILGAVASAAPVG